MAPCTVLCNWHSFSAWRLPESVAQSVKATFPDADVVHLPTLDGHEEALCGCEVFAGSRLPRDAFLKALPTLRWIHSTASSVSQFMYPELVESDVVMTNARTVHAIPMAEHALAMLLALTRHLPSAVRHQAAHHWAQQDLCDEGPPIEIAGSVALIVGFGCVGMEIARRLRTFGVTIHAVTRSGTGDDALAARIVPPAALGSALPEADFVILAAPATPETEHLIGEAELHVMKPTASLLNLARGSLVDEAALLSALHEGRLRGAALDVFEEEPMPRESPLWDAPNLLVTPHVSAVSDRLWPRQTELLLENLARFHDGRPLLNPVDKLRGY